MLSLECWREITRHLPLHDFPADPKELPHIVGITKMGRGFVLGMET